MNIEENRARAIAQQKAHRKFLDSLKKRPPKNLDSLAEAVHDEVFRETDCLECANCCKTTGPLFTGKDIERIAGHLRMKAADFEQKFLRTDEDGDKVLQNLPCFFLGEDNMCAIYDVRPKACREFPHTDRRKVWQINHLTLKNTVICPAAFAWVEKMQQKLG